MRDSKGFVTVSRSKKTPTEKAPEMAEALEDISSEVVQQEPEGVEALESAEQDAAQEGVDAVVEGDSAEEIEEIEPVQIESPAMPQTKQRSGMGGMLLGGVIAAALGAGATYYVLPRVPGLIKDPAFAERVDAAQAEAQSASEQAAQASIKLDTFEPRIAGLENMPGPQEALAAMESKLSALEGRVQELEARPVPSATASQETQEAVDRAVSDMRAELRRELDAIEVEKAAAADVQNSAAKAAKEADARATFARLSAALESGQPFAHLLDQIEAQITSPPQALLEIAPIGAPTLAGLQESFPMAARAALSASTSATQGETAKDRVGAFLRSQLGVRSLEPREGDDPDAVLSRAEAALKQGDLATALQEAAALPADGQTALADWVGLAQTRLDAENALAELAAQLTQ
ncbi:MAG: hypothetical protein ACJA06_000373 [Halocynthiibacter sp.]|jgi:hypothetical protein